jgi:hypothetical protein
MTAPLLSTGDALVDEWVARVYRILRDNNGTVQRCLDCPEEDFDALPPQLRAELREVTTELLPDLLKTPTAA